MFFASDNGSGAAPEIITAITRANDGYARSYGADPIMERVKTLVRDLFEAPEAEVYLVATGTAANSLSIALLTPPWAAIFAHAEAHVAVVSVHPLTATLPPLASMPTAMRSPPNFVQNPAIVSGD